MIDGTEKCDVGSERIQYPLELRLALVRSAADKGDLVIDAAATEEVAGAGQIEYAFATTQVPDVQDARSVSYARCGRGCGEHRGVDTIGHALDAPSPHHAF